MKECEWARKGTRESEKTKRERERDRETERLCAQLFNLLNGRSLSVVLELAQGQTDPPTTPPTTPFGVAFLGVAMAEEED